MFQVLNAQCVVGGQLKTGDHIRKHLFDIDAGHHRLACQDLISALQNDARGAIPETLLDSELFGFEKGAFTGATTQKRGLFERANRGTIFLDEIGELPLPAQTRLLRVIQNHEIKRVGGTETEPIDIRIIIATHRNLEEMVVSRQFRQDLWFRINVFPITIPPLRERKEDIPALLRHFLKRKSKELKLRAIPAVAREDVEMLKTYHWPGNLRELENLVERVLIMHRGQENKTSLRFKGLISLKQKDEKTPVQFDQTDGFLALDGAMKLHIQQALRLSKGKVSGPGGAAERLGIHPNTLKGRMHKLKIPYKRKERG